MDKDIIVYALFHGAALIGNPHERKAISQKVREAYVYSGLCRTMSEKRFNDEVDVSTDAILNNLHSDKRYLGLKTEELDICFNEGYRGTFGKDNYITAITLIRWIEDYTCHETRLSAIRYVSRARKLEAERNRKGAEREKFLREKKERYIDG